MSSEKEPFLARWSRLKHEERAGGAPAPTHGRSPVDRPGEDTGGRAGGVSVQTADAASAPAVPGAEGRTAAPPPLPPLEELTPHSDFSGFMAPQVADALRRAALKKLFLHPEINVPDPFEPFCDDLTVGAPMSDDMLKALHEARETLLARLQPQDSERPDEPLPGSREAEGPEHDDREASKTDEPRQQDA